MAHGEFHVRTLYSGLSTGTERSFFEGTNPALREAIIRHMITTRVPFEEAPGLLADLAARRTHVLQAVLTFREPHGWF